MARASAVRLMAIINVLRAINGENVHQGAAAITPRLSEIINPQSGVGGATPKPRKESELKASNIHDQRMAPSTRTISNTFGSSSRCTIVKVLSPLALAAVIKSRATKSSVALRKIRSGEIPKKKPNVRMRT